jgi:hypothetical protein
MLALYSRNHRPTMIVVPSAETITENRTDDKRGEAEHGDLEADSSSLFAQERRRRCPEVG